MPSRHAQDALLEDGIVKEPGAPSDHGRSRRKPPDAISPTVSAAMSRMPRRNTVPEKRLRRALHADGLRFRIGVGSLPGRPDIVFTRARIAVFVDGCYWHQCPEHSSLPKNNRAWWESKFAGNLERDRRIDQLLQREGWLVVHVWEHEAVSDASERIERLWRDRIGSD